MKTWVVVGKYAKMSSNVVINLGEVESTSINLVKDTF